MRMVFELGELVQCLGELVQCSWCITTGTELEQADGSIGQAGRFHFIS